MPTPLDTANALIDQGKLEQAQAVALRGLASSPNHAGLLAVLGFTTFALGDLARCEYYSRRLLELHPDHPGANANLGTVLMSQARFEEALAPLRRAVAAAPGDDVARTGLASALSGLSRFTEARAVLEEGLRLMPRSVHLRHSLPGVLHAMGRVEEALPLMGELAAEEGATPNILQRWALMHTYAPGVSPAALLEAHRKYARLVEPASPPPRKELPATPPRPLRLGIISPDLRRHSVAHVVEPILEHLDRSRFRVTCYATFNSTDSVTERLRARADGWRQCGTMPDNAIAAAIRADGTDILLDLATLTQGGRPLVLVQRPAPVAIGFAGYPATTGMTSLDYRIVDSITDPPGTEAHSSEKLIRLDPCSTVYKPPGDLPEVSPLPALREGRVTFAAFSSLLKLNGPLIRLWSRVLAAVPRSRLILKHICMKDGAVRAEVVGRFMEAGAPAGSVEALPPIDDVKGHLAAYHQTDITLDTYPYNGTVTILESLLMGVPVISMAGEMTSSRMGLSLLSAAGLSDLCAHNEEEFVAKAAELAGNLDRLASLRAELRQRLLTSPLCDGAAYTRRFEEALLSVYARP
jgi:protein O-GlcNAc transferase